MSGVLGLVRRHPVATYVALAWGLSWAYWVPMAWRGDIVTPGGPISHFPGLVGPLIAAFVVTVVVDGRRGLMDLGARMARWRVAPVWYGIAALPFLMFLAACALLGATGGEVPTVDELFEFSGLPKLAFPLVVLLALIGNGFGEETGWRGYLTPQLLTRRGPIATSLIVAAAWATWHVPSFLVIETYRNMGLAIVPMMGLGLISGAIVLTWIYIGSGGSILIVALWHLALNFGSATTAGRGAPGTLIYLGILVWSILVVIRWLVADEPASRPFFTRLRDGSLIAILRSPLGRLLPGMTVIGFRGRRSGRTLRTPVECVHEAGDLIVFVYQPEKKQWWRNVQADPEVTVEIDGRDVPGRAIVHVGDDPGSVDDLATYVEHHPRVARALGLPIDGSRDRVALAAAATRAVSVRIEARSAATG